MIWKIALNEGLRVAGLSERNITVRVLGNGGLKVPVGMWAEFDLKFVTKSVDEGITDTGTSGGNKVIIAVGEDDKDSIGSEVFVPDGRGSFAGV